MKFAKCICDAKLTNAVKCYSIHTHDCSLEKDTFCGILDVLGHKKVYII